MSFSKIAIGLVLLGCSSLLNAHQNRPSLVSFGAGVFDIIKNPTPQFQIEYKSNLEFYKIHPFAGVFTTTRGSLYGYFGIFGDIFLGKGFVLTPNFAPGLYYKGKGKDLGFVLEFRSCIELSYEFKNKSRFGAQFYHISNASLGHRNPGEESLIFFYAIPIYD